MPTNPHRQVLHDELAALVQRSIAARRRLEAIANGVRFGGDALDTEALRQRLHAELAYLGKEKSRLRHELGLREPTGGFRLAVPTRPRKSVNSRIDAVNRTIAARGYLTRALGFDR